MAEAASGAEAAPSHRSLPDEIVVWEILVRLPTKSLLRCRAVCPAWRGATSTHDFLLAHHARQPSIPLLCSVELDYDGGLDIILFDHRARLAAVDKFQSVARLCNPLLGLKSSCDGLLVLHEFWNNGFSICNPITRQHARLPQLDGFALLGMYPHSPTGEYRLLLGKSDIYYVFTLGSGQPPRQINSSVAEDMVHGSSSILFRGSLHWLVEQHDMASNMITVFNTTTELFKQMRAPAALGRAKLFAMDGMLAMSSCNNAATTIYIWMTLDYDSQAWALKHRVELPVAELTLKFGKFYGEWSVVQSWEGDVLMLIKFGDWLLQIGTDGKLVASFHRLMYFTNQLQLKQSLVPHAFFPTLEGYVVNAPWFSFHLPTVG